MARKEGCVLLVPPQDPRHRSDIPGANVRTSNNTLLHLPLLLNGMACSTKYKEHLKICLEKDPLVISFHVYTIHRKLFSERCTVYCCGA